MAFATDEQNLAHRGRHIIQALAANLGAIARHAPAPPARADRRAVGLCPEIDCVRHRFSPKAWIAAEERALFLGVGADEVLLASGNLDEEDYARALAFALKIPFLELDALPRQCCPVQDAVLVDAAASGMLPVLQGNKLIWVLALQGLNARRLSAYVAGRPDMRGQLRVTSPARMRAFLERGAEEAIAFRAVHALAAKSPALSATTPDERLRWSLASIVSAFAALWLVIPEIFHLVWQAISACVFLGWTILRLSTAVRGQPPSPTPAVPDENLPLYTIIAALRGEARTVRKLVDGLQAIDYPPEKLDIKIVLEPDDEETQAAVAALLLGPPFEIILAPLSGPQTKPKALNAAVPFARGTFTVIFDAEDIPDPDQLRRAAAAFRKGDARLACLQAALTIDNDGDNWLTRVFSAEYASLFDVVLPGLAARGLPIPLGGSSNHFRTDVLRRVGAWDPFNVTEDADLGTRLVRLGYRLDMLASSTLEEAPSELGQWLRQRTRWFKGWMETWRVHTRNPIRFARELGVRGFLTFQLMLAGTAFAALIQPFVVYALLARAAGGELLCSTDAGFAACTFAWVSFVALVGGYLTTAVLGLMGLRRRGMLRNAWALLGIPILWALLSIAAWRALLQLFVDPYGWEKTEHGRARTSRAQTQAGNGILARTDPAHRFPEPRGRSVPV